MARATRRFRAARRDRLPLGSVAMVLNHLLGNRGVSLTTATDASLSIVGKVISTWVLAALMASEGPGFRCGLGMLAGIAWGDGETSTIARQLRCFRAKMDVSGNQGCICIPPGCIWGPETGSANSSEGLIVQFCHSSRAECLA